MSLNFALGIDSGAHSGISLISREGFLRPRVELTFGILGTRQELWLDRASSALCEVRSHLAGRPFVVAIEEPPKAARASTLHGDPRGQRTWQGMGRRRGMLEALCYVHLGVVPEALSNQDWTRSLAPIVAKKKLGEGKQKGLHRIREAILLLDNAKELIVPVTASCQVDAAESMLLGLAMLSIAHRSRGTAKVVPDRDSREDSRGTAKAVPDRDSQEGSGPVSST